MTQRLHSRSIPRQEEVQSILDQTARTLRQIRRNVGKFNREWPRRHSELMSSRRRKSAFGGGALGLVRSKATLRCNKKADRRLRAMKALLGRTKRTEQQKNA